MGDKEERILITKCSGWCHALRISCDPFDNDDGMYCDKSGKWVRITEKDCAKCKNPVLSGMTRAEAVERMAQSLYNKEEVYCNNLDCKQYGGLGETCEGCQVWEKYEHLAEAALDALLGEKK